MAIRGSVVDVGFERDLLTGYLSSLEKSVRDVVAEKRMPDEISE